MSSIQEPDIEAAAQALVDTLIVERETNGQSAEYARWAVMMVKRALLAERRRQIERDCELLRETLNSDNYRREDFVMMGPAGIIR